jgi:hypothetical protein
MIPYNAISDLLSDGKTPAQIAALLAVRTVKPIPISDLENFLDFNNVAKRNPITSQWEGPLVDAMNNEALPAELRGGISSLLTHFNKPRSVQVDTTQEPWASGAADLIGALVAIGILSETQAGDVLALAGGHKYPGVNATAVQAAIDAEVIRIARSTAHTRMTDKINAANAALSAAYDAGATAEQMIAVTEAAWAESDDL